MYGSLQQLCITTTCFTRVYLSVTKPQYLHDPHKHFLKAMTGQEAERELKMWDVPEEAPTHPGVNTGPLDVSHSGALNPVGLAVKSL